MISISWTIDMLPDPTTKEEMRSQKFLLVLVMVVMEEGGLLLTLATDKWFVIAVLVINSGKREEMANVTVATDGSGQFRTITAAIKSLPQKNEKRLVVLVKAGKYNEQVTIPSGMNNVSLIGEGPLVTTITGDRSQAGGCDIHCSATLTIDGEGFFAKDIGIENTAPASQQQAVAVRVNGDMAVFHKVHIDGHQDTLLAETNRQFYRDCRISGTIDFIFGDAVAVFQNCDIVVRKPLLGQQCTITAQGRKEANGDGVNVIQGCRITAEQALLDAQPPVSSYLGRPWKEYSRAIIMQSDIGGFISSEGWLPWERSSLGFGTAYYGEWGNTGAGSDTWNRVVWKQPGKVLTAEMARSFTADKVFVNDAWVKNSGVPYVGGLLPKLATY